MNAPRLLLALALLFALPALSRAQTPPPAATPPLAITLVPTAQYSTHDIYARTLDHNGPGFEGLTRLFPGQRIDLVILAQNYALDATRRASLVYDLDITYPGGRTQRAGHDLRLCTGPVPDPGLLAYASQTASYSTDPGDPLGDYTFTVTARDRVSRAPPLQKTITLHIVPYAEPALPADFNPFKWMANYYLAPSPSLALPALFKISAILPVTDTDSWPPVLGFYEALLKDNPWLATPFLERLKNATPADRTLLLFVLGYAWRDDPAFANLITTRWPDVDHGPLTDPMQLDLLWGRFYATGAYAPVERITTALRAHETLGALDRLKASDPGATRPTQQVMQELTLKSAQWSLGANARLHPLVLRYCRWLLAQPDPDAAFRTLLADCLPDALHASSPPPAPQPMVTFPLAH